MISFGKMIRWSWLLGIALFAPVALPAGGGELEKPKIRLGNDSCSFIAGSKCILRSSPLVIAPSLRMIDIGTPLQVLRSWKSEDGNYWLQIQISSGELFELSDFVKRGWINI